MKLIIANKAFKGHPVGSELDIADRHAKVLVAIGRATYGTRDMVAEAPRRRGRPPKAAPVLEQTDTPQTDTPPSDAPQ